MAALLLQRIFLCLISWGIGVFIVYWYVGISSKYLLLFSNKSTFNNKWWFFPRLAPSPGYTHVYNDACFFWIGKQIQRILDYKCYISAYCNWIFVIRGQMLTFRTIFVLLKLIHIYKWFLHWTQNKQKCDICRPKK